MTWQSDDRRWSLNSEEEWIEFFAYCANHPENEEAQWVLNVALSSGAGVKKMYDRWQQSQQFLNNAQESGDWNGYYQNMNNAGLPVDPMIEKFVDNNIARGNTEQAQQFEEHMRDTNITSSAQQYAMAGLSPSSVVSGGISTGNGVAAADNAFGSRAMDRQQLAMQKYQTHVGMAKGLLGMISQMASSGIYGAAIGSARNAAARITSAAAHSGLQALQNMRPELRNQLMKDQAARETRASPYNEY